MVVYCDKNEPDLECLKCDYVYDDDEALYCSKRRGDILNEELCIMCGNSVPEGRMICHKCESIEPSFDTVKATVLLDKITDIKDFVYLASKCSDDVVIGSGRFKVNAKSIMALFSLDLSKPLKVEFYGDIPYEVKEGMEKFIVN